MPARRLVRLLLTSLLAMLLTLDGATAAEPLGAGAGAAPAPEQRFREPYGRYQAALAARDLESAAVHARRAYQLAEQELGPDDLQTGILAFNLGAVSLELKRYSDAVPALESAARVYRLHYGDYDERNLPPEQRLGESLQKLERWAPAERHYVRAVQIIDRQRGRDDPALADILVELVNVALELEEWKRARSYGLRAIGLIQRARPDDDTALGLLHVRMAGNELRLGDPTRASKHMDKGLDILEERLAEDDPRWGQIYVLASQTYLYAGKDATSRRYKRSARKLGYEVPEPDEEEEEE